MTKQLKSIIERIREELEYARLFPTMGLVTLVLGLLGTAVFFLVNNFLPPESPPEEEFSTSIIVDTDTPPSSTPTPTRITPTSTTTATASKTATSHLQTTTPTPTATVTLTPALTPTLSATVTVAPPTSLPSVITLTSFSCTDGVIETYKPGDKVTFTWQYNGRLASGQYVEVRIGPQAAGSILESLGSVPVPLHSNEWSFTVKVNRFFDERFFDYHWSVVHMAANKQTAIVESVRGCLHVENN